MGYNLLAPHNRFCDPLIYKACFMRHFYNPLIYLTLHRVRLRGHRTRWDPSYAGHPKSGGVAAVNRTRRLWVSGNVLLKYIYIYCKDIPPLPIGHPIPPTIVGGLCPFSFPAATPPLPGSLGSFGVGPRGASAPRHPTSTMAG